MVLTGTSSYIYSFYHQSGMSAKFQTDSMKDMNFRILTNSGGNYYQDILFSSGKVFAGNNMTTGGWNFVGGYQQNSALSFEIKYNTGRYSFYLNDSIKFSNKQILNSQIFQPYTEKPTITGFQYSGRSSGNLTGTTQIWGTQPGVYFSTLYPYNYPAQTGLYSGYIIISGLPGYLYSISPENGSQQTIPGSAFTSGGYILTGLNFGSGSTINTDFNFNFGLINTNLSVYQSGGGVGPGFLNVSQAAAGAIFFGLPTVYQYQDYLATNLINTTGNFENYLEFLYRSGRMIISGTGTMTGNMTGYISGSGYLYGSGTGYTTQGFYNQRGVTYSIPGFNSGYSGEMTPRFVYGTGQVVYNYSVLATGTEDTLYYGHDSTTGRLTGSLTGTIYDGSGYYRFQQVISGRPQFWSGAYPTGNQAAGGYYNFQDSNSHYLETFSGNNYTYNLDVTVHWTGNISKQYTQPFTGTYYSGVYQTGSGYITGFNMLTGDPSLLTGGYEYINSNYYNYTGNGHISGRFIRKNTIPRGPGVYEYGIRVTHDRNLPQEVYDFYKITVTDGTNSYVSTGTAFYL